MIASVPNLLSLLSSSSVSSIATCWCGGLTAVSPSASLLVLLPVFHLSWKKSFIHSLGFVFFSLSILNPHICSSGGFVFPVFSSVFLFSFSESDFSSISNILRPSGNYETQSGVQFQFQSSWSVLHAGSAPLHHCLNLSVQSTGT